MKVIKGENILVHCGLINVPLRDISWYFEIACGSFFPIDEINQFTKGVRYSIGSDSLELHDVKELSGIKSLHCHGKDTSENQKEIIYKLQIISPPKLQKLPPNKLLLPFESRNAELICVADQNSHFEWVFNGEFLNISNKYALLLRTVSPTEGIFFIRQYIFLQFHILQFQIIEIKSIFLRSKYNVFHNI